MLSANTTIIGKGQQEQQQETEEGSPKNKKLKIEVSSNAHQRKQTKTVKHINVLPKELFRLFLEKLSIIELLYCERIDPQWNRAMWTMGWKERKELSAKTVFDGASQAQVEKFNVESLISLFHRVGKNLVEFDLFSFGYRSLKRFVTKIAQSLKLLPRLEKLNIRGCNLHDFVNHLPNTLRELERIDRISIETLETLSRHCPNLESVPFQAHQNDINFDTVVELIGKFPRQKKLTLSIGRRSEKIGALASIGQLRELEELYIWGVDILDGVSLEAIVGGCQRLRAFFFCINYSSEKDLFQLGKIIQLTTLIVYSRGREFTDTVLKEIAQRGQLKKLIVYGHESETLTDKSIIALVNQCKSLVSLFFCECPRITERSVEAIVAEVRRRHGMPPRTLPSGKDDPGIFYFDFPYSGIDERRARELVEAYSWLIFGYDPRIILI